MTKDYVKYKTITMSYYEYTELIELIKKYKEFIRDYYNLTEKFLNKETKIDIIKFLQKYCDWI